MLKTLRKQLFAGALAALLAVTGAAPSSIHAAAQKAAVSLDDLFPDEVLAKGKGLQVTRKEVDEAWIAFKANTAARGQQVPITEEQAEPQLVDRIIMVKLLLTRANETDKTRGRERADKILKDLRNKSNTPENLDRQLKSLGVTSQRFWEQLLERAICEEVMEREVKSGVKIPAADVKKFYDDNPARFTIPERVKLQHILFALRDARTGGPMNRDQIAAVRTQAETVLLKARAGDDFNHLIQTYSQEPTLKETKGEMTIARGQTIEEFEAAAFSLPIGKISDIVMSGFGFHILKVIEKMPPEKIEFDKVKENVEEGLVLREVERLMPDFLEKMKKEANVEYFGGLAEKMKKP